MNETTPNSTPESNSANAWDELAAYAEGINASGSVEPAPAPDPEPSVPTSESSIENPEPTPTALPEPTPTITPESPITATETPAAATETPESPAPAETAQAPEIARSNAEETRLAGNFLDDFLSHYEKTTDPAEQGKLRQYIDISQRFFSEISDPENQSSVDQIFDKITDQYNRSADLYLRLHRDQGANEYHQRALAVQEIRPRYENFTRQNSLTSAAKSESPAPSAPESVTDQNPAESPAVETPNTPATELAPQPTETPAESPTETPAETPSETPAETAKPDILNADWLI